MILTNELRTAMLDAYERRLAGYPRHGTLLEEALELLQFGDISGWVPMSDLRWKVWREPREFSGGLKHPNWKHEKGSRS